MADNFGLKIGVEGEKEFKKALSEINSTMKVLGLEMLNRYPNSGIGDYVVYTNAKIITEFIKDPGE